METEEFKIRDAQTAHKVAYRDLRPEVRDLYWGAIEEAAKKGASCCDVDGMMDTHSQTLLTQRGFTIRVFKDSFAKDVETFRTRISWY